MLQNNFINDKEDNMSNKLINYIVNQNKEAICNKVENKLIDIRKIFIERGMNYLAEKLQNPEGDDIKKYINDVIDSEEFDRAVFNFSNISVYNQNIEKNVKHKMILDKVRTDIDSAIKNIYYFISQPKFENLTFFDKDTIHNLLGNISDSAKASVLNILYTRQILQPGPEPGNRYFVDRNRINEYITKMNERSLEDVSI